MVCYESLDSSQLHGPKAQISGKRYRVQPKLGGIIVAVDMYMRGLCALVAVEVNTVRT